MQVSKVRLFELYHLTDTAKKGLCKSLLVSLHDASLTQLLAMVKYK